jgi:epoxide hydrolase-like predicted phosphatase
MIKAIIFDCFGVLVVDSLGSFYDKYLYNQSEKIEEADLFAEKSNRGEISYEEFIIELSRISGVGAKKVDLELAKNPPNNELLHYIRKFALGNYKIAMLSNASDNWINELFTPEDTELFSEVILSYKVGIAKPDPRIFELAANRLGVEPQECVFIDDLEKYLVGARQAGMKTILYTDFASFKKELENVLG